MEKTNFKFSHLMDVTLREFWSNKSAVFTYSVFATVIWAAIAFMFWMFFGEGLLEIAWFEDTGDYEGPPVDGLEFILGFLAYILFSMIVLLAVFLGYIKFMHAQLAEELSSPLNAFLRGLKMVPIAGVVFFVVGFAVQLLMGALSMISDEMMILGVPVQYVLSTWALFMVSIFVTLGVSTKNFDSVFKNIKTSGFQIFFSYIVLSILVGMVMGIVFVLPVGVGIYFANDIRAAMFWVFLISSFFMMSLAYGVTTMYWACIACIFQNEIRIETSIDPSPVDEVSLEK